jgi:hypothetical protein
LRIDAGKNFEGEATGDLAFDLAPSERLVIKALGGPTNTLPISRVEIRQQDSAA